MSQQELLYPKPGDRVTLIATDPWELVTVIGSGPFVGSIVAVDTAGYRVLSFKLEQPLRYEGIIAGCLAAFARHAGDKFATSTGSGRKVFCNIRSVSDDEAKLGVLPILDEGRLSLIGDVEWTSSA
jgi:hypothetical protein